MEHYERHCPSPERWYNCLIPPPPGYKVPIKWPKSRDEVWKANLPHTHLANEQSDQNWMVVKGDRISFPGGGIHFHYGADEYIDSMANIQFALQRGIPAYLGVLGMKRLPYPCRAFELAHCSRCRIDWLQRDGILLLELDWLLRPGGYFAYSSLEAYAQDEEDLRIWKLMSELVERMCWRIAAKRNQTVIWQKSLTNDCYLERKPGTHPPLC